ncbi:hypothetical protein RSOLAG22IIIB_05138 [Rhizoctonia solani]|uniref:Uncharacterized protein n=1 Tax=Rhizoctonia solani TaxID=456999 RepID=A0A0K6G3A9_9AGAM|nr:hypothetical protein RSOLAG22IIIB_05138 [Rhizoctonia solani]
MPTFAGYIMKTPDHVLEWLRARHPELQANEDYLPSDPLYELMQKHNIHSMFRFERIVLPGPPETDGLPNCRLNPKRLGVMFIRRTCPGDHKIWMPQREIPGVASDSYAGKLLKKWGLVTTDWVVLHMPADDPRDLSGPQSLGGLGRIPLASVTLAELAAHIDIYEPFPHVLSGSQAPGNREARAVTYGLIPA